MPAWIILAAIALYSGLLYAIAFRADRSGRDRPPDWRYAFVFGLSLAVYCTSWTYYGAVGSAARAGWDYLPIYLGPILAFTVGAPLLRRLVAEGKRIHTTSIADFLSARYGRSRELAALVTVIAVLGATPYIALQLQAATTTMEILAGGAGLSYEIDLFLVALVFAAFAALFGARTVDMTVHNRGLVQAIAFDSAVKLGALIVVAALAVGLLAGAPDRLAEIANPFAAPIPADRFATLTGLAFIAVLCLPRQFHMLVVECRSEASLRIGGAVFVVYLAAVSLVAAPITLAGLAAGPEGGNPDLFVLTLPMAHDAAPIALAAFIGGFAAATGMIVVAGVALSAMITNDLIAPFFLTKHAALAGEADYSRLLLRIRRGVIGGLMLIAAIYAILAPSGAQLANFGILSFAAAAQFAPALIGGLYWSGARRQGAFWGLSAGVALWAWCLAAPAFAPSLWTPTALLAPLGLTPLSEGVLASLGVNAALFVLGSRLAAAPAADAPPPSASLPTDGRSAAGMRLSDARALLGRFLGETEADTAFASYFSGAGLRPDEDAPVDAALAQFAESRLSRALGASSARVLMTGALAGRGLNIDEVAAMLDATSQRLQFSQELLQTTLENISQGVSVIDRDLRLVAWNSAYVKLFDYPPAIVRVGRPIADLIRHNARRGLCGGEEVDAIVEKRLTRLREGRPHVFERARPDGRVVKLEGAPIAGGGYVTSFTDVTPYKKVQAALEESEQAIRFYTDNIPSMIAYTSADQRIRFANKAYRETFGRPGEEIVGLHVRDLLSPEAYRARAPMIEAALLGEPVAFDTEMPDAEGGSVLFQVNYFPQTDGEGVVQGFFGLYQDVTARREAEQALADANETLEQRVAERTAALSELNTALEAARAQAEAATASKTSFLAAASHDVLQPLNAARLFASALAEEIRHDSPAGALAEKIGASIASADRLLRALLNISKLDAGGIEPEFAVFSIAELFDELESEFSVIAEEHGLDLRVRGQDVFVESDRGLLRSALQNLLSNALRYTDSGGVLLACRTRGAHVRLEVYDTGRGIPEEKLEEIFVEFRRLRRDADQAGAGLGLAIVERITRLLRQPVTVVSTLGRGTRFAIEAPISQSAPPLRLRSSSASPLPSHTGRLLAGKAVLCLDNDQQILDALGALLLRWGARPLLATDEAAAREVAPEAPDLVLLDYRLDRDATGVGQYEALCAAWSARPPAILITASQSDGFQAEAQRIGAPVIAKPVEPAALRALIAQMVRGAAE